METTIKALTEKYELLCTYPGQTSPQGAYIELDTGTGEISAEYNPEIGNAVPMRVWNGITIRYGIPLLTDEAANSLMEELQPLLERVYAGTETVWNGNNHVGRMDEDAAAAHGEIEQTLERMGQDEEDTVSDGCDGNWEYELLRAVTAESTDAQIAQEASDAVAEADSGNVLLDEDSLVSAMKERRHELKADSTEDDPDGLDDGREV